MAEWNNLTHGAKKALVTEKDDLGLFRKSTGEVVDLEKYDITRKTQPHQMEWRKRTDEMALYTEEQDGFVFTFYKLAGKGLSQADLARLLFMATYLRWGSNRLAYGNGEAITKKHLQELLKLKERAFREFYRTVTALGILIEEDKGETLKMNAEYFYKGKLDEKVIQTQEIAYTRTYVKGMRELYETYGHTRQVKQLGVLYLLIPHVHYDTNILVSNPNETERNKLKELNLEEIANVLCYDPSNISKTLKSIIIGDEYVFLIADAGSYKSVVVNPRIFWRAKTSPKGTIDTLFQLRKAHRLGSKK